MGCWLPGGLCPACSSDGGSQGVGKPRTAGTAPHVLVPEGRRRALPGKPSAGGMQGAGCEVSLSLGRVPQKTRGFIHFPKHFGISALPVNWGTQ